jgi:hypothetical protein
MNKSIINDEVQWLLEAINEQADVLRSYPDRIPQIELDMLMENVRKLYENLHLLDRLNDQYDAVLKNNPVAEKEPEIIVDTIFKPVFAPEPEAVLKDEAVPDPAPVQIRYSAAEVRKQEEPVAEAELFPGEEYDFSGKLKEAREKALGMTEKKQKPAELKGMITINDKFMLINELFDGNLKDYNENIETLNGFHDLRSAFDYLDLLRQKNRWEAENKGFKKLKSLIEAQFPA